MKGEMNIKVEKADYHRNGIGGNGFHVCLFTFTDEGVPRRMLGVLFEARGSCAVFDRDLLTKDVIGMFEECKELKRVGNAWRGDNFEDELRKQVKVMMDRKWDESRKQWSGR